MSFENSKPSRRSFLLGLATSVVAVPFIGRIVTGVAHAAAALVPENNPVASALGYVDDVNKAKNKPKKPGPNQKCDNCALFTATTSGQGKCSMITAGEVKAGGWCNSWQAKKK